MSLTKIPKVQNKHPYLYFLGLDWGWIYALRLTVPVRFIGVDRAAVDTLSENTRAIALILRVLNTAASRNQLAPIQDAFQDFFQDRLNRIDLLVEVLNERFLYKKIRFSDQSGFTFNTDAGLEILPDNLSSGEKNLWRLFTELLFIDTPGTLVLIDGAQTLPPPVVANKFLGRTEKNSQPGKYRCHYCDAFARHHQ